jgi:hypothetical protein
MLKLAAVMVSDSDVPWFRVTPRSIATLNVCEHALQSFLIDAADDGLDLRLFDSQVANAIACRDGRYQLGCGDLVTPKAQPTSWAIGASMAAATGVAAGRQPGKRCSSGQSSRLRAGKYETKARGTTKVKKRCSIS